MRRRITSATKAQHFETPVVSSQTSETSMVSSLVVGGVVVVVGVGVGVGIVSGALPALAIGAITGALAAEIVGAPLLPISILGAVPGTMMLGGSASAIGGMGVLAIGAGVLATGVVNVLAEVFHIIEEEEISLMSTTKMILATTPLYWMHEIFASLQKEGLGSKIMECVEAMAATLVTSITIADLLLVTQKTGFTLLTGTVAAMQLVDAYRTWNKYSALEAETGQAESSKLPVVGLQLLTGTAIVGAASIGLLSGLAVPIILGATQLALHSYADKVISERRNHAEAVYMV